MGRGPITEELGVQGTMRSAVTRHITEAPGESGSLVIKGRGEGDVAQNDPGKSNSLPDNMLTHKHSLSFSSGGRLLWSHFTSVLPPSQKSLSVPPTP